MFRKEAINSHQVKWHGKALLLPGIPLWMILFVSFLLFFALVAFITQGSYTRRINVSGTVVSSPRAVTVFSAEQGFVLNTLVSAGDVVQKGQPVMEIDVSRSTYSGVVSKNQEREILHQIETIDNIIDNIQENKRTTLESLRQQKQRYDDAYILSTDVIGRAKEGIDIMEEQMNDYRSYRERGLVGKETLANKIALYYQQQSDLLTLSSQSEQNALESSRIASQIQTKAADFDNQMWEMQLQKDSLNRELATTNASDIIVVTSPANGRVDSLSVGRGQMVNIGDSLLQILPEPVDHHLLVIWVPNTALPYIKIGDVVNLRYDAFPAEKFGQFPGRISLIGQTPASEQEMATYPGAPVQDLGSSEPYYKVLVAPGREAFNWHHRTLTLENGMKAQSTLFLEKRKLYQWMVAPLYDMKTSVVGPISE